LPATSLTSARSAGSFGAFGSILFAPRVNPNVVTIAEKARLFKEKDDINHPFERSFEEFDKEKQIKDDLIFQKSL